MFSLCSLWRGVEKEVRMARIKREDHARVLQLVDVERRAVREIAAEFGCTPAAIYALLKKLRLASVGAAPEPAEPQPPLALGSGTEAAEPVTDSAAPVSEPSAPSVPSPPQEEPRRVVSFERSAPPPPAREPVRRPAAAAVGGKLAKPGMGLVMRTPDGEETVTPFRSIDDLLSAIKPILRAGARSPEAVWFSLQPVDLSTVDVDAA
jgi:transposase-like protein